MFGGLPQCDDYSDLVVLFQSPGNATDGAQVAVRSFGNSRPICPISREEVCTHDVSDVVTADCTQLTTEIADEIILIGGREELKSSPACLKLRVRSIGFCCVVPQIGNLEYRYERSSMNVLGSLLGS